MAGESNQTSSPLKDIPWQGNYSRQLRRQPSPGTRSQRCQPHRREYYSTDADKLLGMGGGHGIGEMDHTNSHGSGRTSNSRPQTIGDVSCCESMQAPKRTSGGTPPRTTQSYFRENLPFVEPTELRRNDITIGRSSQGIPFLSRELAVVPHQEDFLLTPLPQNNKFPKPDPPCTKRLQSLDSIVTFHRPSDAEEPSPPEIHVRPRDIFVDNTESTLSTPYVNKDASWDHKSTSSLKKIMRHRTLIIFQLLLAFYVGFLTYADIGPPGGLRDQATGLIVDKASVERTNKGIIVVNGAKRAIVASTMFQVVIIGIARLSAFFMYPALVVVFISKFRATTSFLARTPVSMFINGDWHELHVYCGWTILLFSTIHSVCHLARWGQQGNLYLSSHHVTGVTGLLILTSMCLICLPMVVCRGRIKYEIRKNLHYCFVVFALCLAFHTSPTAIPNGGFTSWIFGSLLVAWVLDAAYCTFIMTEKIETTKFEVLPTGVQMTMGVSLEFDKRGTQGGFCYVCFPWVDAKQWHAFSIVENPENPVERQIFVQRAGDWTKQVHTILQRDTVRPVWIQGPFPSPYHSADAYDNQILIASGIGITPALSVIRAHKESRRINLIWAVRDCHLLEFFLRHLYLDSHGWNLIFYTGNREELHEEKIKIYSNTNVCIIYGRPRLFDVIPNIIYGIESGKGMPETYNPKTKAEASKQFADVMLSKRGKGDLSIATSEMMIDLSEMAAIRGYGLDEMSHSEKRALLKSGSSEYSSDCTDAEHHAKAIMEQLRIGFKPWETASASARGYVKNLDEKLVLSTWGMLYCGGAKTVEVELKNLADEYKIDLHIESFAW